MNDKKLSNHDGWNALFFSNELQPLQVESTRMLNQDFVLFRNKFGAPGILGAYCIHMGAHLGKGWVNGENLVCPFHEWHIGRNGKCHSPQKTVFLPEKFATGQKKQPNFPAFDLNGIIWGWFGPQNLPRGLPVKTLEIFNNPEIGFNKATAIIDGSRQSFEKFLSDMNTVKILCEQTLKLSKRNSQQEIKLKPFPPYYSYWIKEDFTLGIGVTPVTPDKMQVSLLATDSDRHSIDLNRLLEHIVSGKD